MAKGKFLCLLSTEQGVRVFVKDETFTPPENTKYTLEDSDYMLPLSQFSTDDLLKLKAQIATHLETRMDLDEVTEKNLNAMKEALKGAGSVVVAQLIRQTMERLEVIASDEKRAKTRLAILSDEMEHRMREEGVSEQKFAGLVNISYDKKRVYNVGEDGWGAVYGDIVDKLFTDEIHEFIKDFDFRDDSFFTTSEIFEMVLKKVKSSPALFDAFGLLNKRLSSNVLRDLEESDQSLPKGIEAQTIRKLKILKNKK